MNKLEKDRKKIDDIDATLVKLIAKRMRVVRKIGKYKKRNEIEIDQPKRWNQVLKRVTKMGVNTGALDEDVIEEIWTAMHEYAKHIEEEV